MRSAARTIAASAPALAVVAVAWLRLEQPVGSLWPVLALLGLALAAAVPTHRWLRAVGAVAATVLAARVAVGVDLVPWRLNHPGSGFGVADSFSTLGTRFGNGFSDFYGTHLPFDPRVHVAMHELVLSGLFLFALAVTLFAAARKPAASALMLLVGAGWPATLLGPSRGIAMGAAILGGALVLLGGLGSRRVPALAIPAAVVVAVAAIAVGSATAARHGLVHWQSWNLAHVATGPSDVGFVWNAQYGGLKFSGHPTNVLQVVSDRPPTYLRATVLDDFRNDKWEIGVPRPADSLEPVAAHRPRNQTRESVTVTALADTHLVGGSIPMRFEAADGAPLVRLEPGFAALNQNLPQGFRYTVWSYAAHPTPAALRRSPPDYPTELEEQGLLTVGEDLTALPFGFPNRPTVMLGLLTRPDLFGYVPLARLAERLAGDARTPYDAVEKLQQWFLSSGTFHYSNHPPVSSLPLVGFVTKTHAGYCQHFAGAMALMLRYLGIPARVAVGFAGGTYDPSAAPLEHQRPRGPCLGRGLVQGLRLAAVRPDAGRPGRSAARDAGRAAGGRSPGIDLVHGRWSNVRCARRVGVRAEAERRTTGSTPARADTTGQARRCRASAAAVAVPIAAGRYCFCSPASPRRWEASCWPRSAFV